MRARRSQRFIPKSIVLSVALATSAIATGAWGAPVSPWLFIDAPTGGHLPQAVAISGHNQIAGTYENSDSSEHGFLRTPDGTVTTIDVPGATNTIPTGINIKGAITGYASLSDGTEGSFIRDAAGTYQTFEVPHTDATMARAVSGKGVVAGDLRMTGQPANNVAFVRSAKGTITTFAPANTFQLQTMGIADNGAVVGLVADTSLNIHGFLRNSQGTLTTFAVPSTYTTIPFGINQKSQIAGAYRNSISDPSAHGFVREANGTFTTFEISGPGITPAVTMTWESINFSGVIAGCYLDASGNNHGFVRDENGNLQQLDAPGATSTCPKAINARGKIAGNADSRAFRLNRRGWIGK